MKNFSFLSYIWEYILARKKGAKVFFLSNDSLGFSFSELEKIENLENSKKVFIFLNINSIFNIRGFIDQIQLNYSKNEKNTMEFLSHYFTHLVTYERIMYVIAYNFFFYRSTQKVLGSNNSLQNTDDLNSLYQTIHNNILPNSKPSYVLRKIKNENIKARINSCKINHCIMGYYIFHEKRQNIRKLLPCGINKIKISNIFIYSK